MKTYLRPQITQCQGKKAFGSYRDAIAGRQRLHGLQAYRCPHCGQFHVGNKPKDMGRPKPPPPAIEMEF